MVPVEVSCTCHAASDKNLRAKEPARGFRTTLSVICHCFKKLIGELQNSRGRNLMRLDTVTMDSDVNTGESGPASSHQTIPLAVGSI